MSFVMNLTDNDPHLECRREIHRLRAENEQLRAELAAIRDARDEEIDDICRPYVSQHFQHIIENDEYMRDIAKARGQKIAEQAAEIQELRAGDDEEKTSLEQSVASLGYEVETLREEVSEEAGNCESLEYTDYIRVIAHLIRQGKLLVGLLETVGVTADIWDLTPAEEAAVKTFEEIE